MPARFYCRTGELSGADFDIGEEATIGRSGDNAVTLRPSLISTHHARIYYDAGAKAYFVEDLGSRNGTAVDGVPVTELVRLDALNVITLAQAYDFIFQATAATTPETSRSPHAGRQAASEARTQLGDAFDGPANLPGQADEGLEEKTRAGDPFAPVPDLRNEDEGADDQRTQLGDDFGAVPSLGDAAEGQKTQLGDDFGALPDIGHEGTRTRGPDERLQQPRYRLVVKPLDGEERRHDLKEGENVVGRVDEADVTIADRAVSRRHARILVQAGTVRIKDLGSKNFTFVDGKRISDEVEVRPGSSIRLGPQIEAILEEA